VIGPFAEAIRATAQPCTFLLIVPVLVASFVARNQWRSFAAIVAAAVVGGWLVAANRFVLDGGWLRVAALLVAIGLSALVVPAVTDAAPQLASANARATIAGAVTLVATMWWRPCVGNELGTILTGAQTGLASQLVPMAVYMLGAMTPVAAVVLANQALEPSERAARLASWGALAIGLVITTSLVAGQHDSVVVTLTRWTLN